jgi:zinc protease
LAALVMIGLASSPVIAQPAAPAKQPATRPAVPRAAGAAVGKLGAPPAAHTKLPAVETFALSNGLSVAVLRSEMVPAVSVQLWVRAGSKDEPRDRRGLAQVLARAMWKGSKRVRPDAHAQMVASLGGKVSGGTDEDSTHFGNDLPSGYLDFALQLEAERMRGLQLRDSVIKTARDQLATELRQEDSSPLARGLRRLLELAFTKHTYAWPSGGVATDLIAVTTDDVRRYYDTYYVPNNALLVVAGDVTVEAVRESAQKHFGAFAASPITRNVAADAEPALSAQRREITPPSQLGVVLIGYSVPAAANPDWAALQVAAAILGSGEGSRIKQRLRAAGKEIGLDGGVSTQPREHPSLFIALAAYREANGGAPVEAALLDELAKLAQRGPTKDELRTAKTQLQTRAAYSLESADGIASQIGRTWILTGDVKTFATEIDRIEAVKLEDIKRVLTMYLRPERATILTVPPAPPKAAKP